MDGKLKVIIPSYILSLWPACDIGELVSTAQQQNK